MKRLFTSLIALAAVCLVCVLTPVRAQESLGADPIITTVDSSGMFVVTRQFTDGHTTRLVRTDSISDAQRAWLDAVNKLAQGK